jgi:hypothetical protein
MATTGTPMAVSNRGPRASVAASIGELAAMAADFARSTTLPPPMAMTTSAPLERMESALRCTASSSGSPSAWQVTTTSRAAAPKAASRSTRSGDSS